MNMNGLSTPNSLAELARSISIQVTGSSQHKRFQRAYQNDRIAFAYDVLGRHGQSLTPYQEEILGYFDSGVYRVAVRGPHGLGKTYLASILVHHAVLTAEEDAKIPTTASAWRQLEKYLWPEVHKISSFLDWGIIGREPYNQRTELFNLSIKIQNQAESPIEAFAVASDDHNTIEGAHGRLLFYIFDEAKAIPRNTWNAVEGAFSNAKILNSKLTDGLPDLIRNPLLQDGIEEGRKAWANNFGKARVIRIPRIPPEERTAVNSSKLAKWIEMGEDSERMRRAETIGEAKSVKERIGGKEEGEIIERESDLIESANSGPLYSGVLYDGDSMVERIVGEKSGVNSVETLTNPPTYTTPRASSNTTADQVSILSNTDQTRRGRYRSDQEQSTTPDKAFAFAISTPGDPSGQFYDIHSHKQGYEDWVTRHVTIEEAIRAGRISADWVRQRERQWGKDSPIFQNRVLGEFADQSEEGIIPLSWIRSATERWKDWNKHRKELYGRRVLGVDPARYGSDKTVVAKRVALAITDLYYFSKLSTTSLAGYLLGMLRGYYLNIEMDGGLAAGVVDMLREKDVPNIRPITVSAKTSFTDRSKELRFANVRAAMWWNVRELLDPRNGFDSMLPPVEELVLDLSTPKYEVLSNGYIALESKEGIMSRLGRSPDYGSAVCLAFWDGGSSGGAVVI